MATVARETVIRENLLIGGQRRPARSGRYFETVNPADERVIALVAEADASDIAAAVASAREALEGEWGHLRAADRGEALRRLADLVRRHEDEDEVVERLVARAKSIRVGDPRDAATSMGPIVSSGQMNRVLDYIDIGRKEGAQIATGGARLGDTGYFVSPTVFTGVAHDMRISQEEIFGPVASVVRFKDDEEAIRLANGTKYGLAAGVWSADIGRVHRFVRRLKAGTVWANTYGPTDVRLPWGGARDSGFGREHGDAAIENFTEPKAVWINTGR